MAFISLFVSYLWILQISFCDSYSGIAQPVALKNKKKENKKINKIKTKKKKKEKKK